MYNEVLATEIIAEQESKRKAVLFQLEHWTMI